MAIDTDTGSRKLPTFIASERGQEALLWWAIGFAAALTLAWILLIRTLPLPPATWTSEQIAHFYRQHSIGIRWGAAVCSWTAAFTVPFSVVLAVQIARLEKGFPIWALTQALANAISSLFIVLPMMLFGVAAFSPDRAPDVTAGLHQFALLSLVTADQYFIFNFIAIAIACLIQSERKDVYTPFPRWMGYFTLWCALLFEAGAIAFVPKTGPFAWNGILAFYLPFGTYGVWFTCMCVLLFRALRHQRRARLAAT